MRNMPIEITNVDEAPYFDRPDAGNPELYTVKVKETMPLAPLLQNYGVTMRILGMQ